MSVIPVNRLQWVTVVLAVGLLTGVAGFVIGQRAESYPPRGSVDAGFLVDMIDHHDQAVQMSLIEIRNGATPEIQHFAHEILRQQSVEIGLMTAKLEEWGLERRAEVGTAMAWMDHPHQSDAMPGMASETEMRDLGLGRGRDADALFVRLMKQHHQGGADMAEYAAENASTAWVQDIAGRMASVQRQEIREMDATRQRFGLAV